MMYPVNEIVMIEHEVLKPQRSPLANTSYIIGDIFVHVYIRIEYDR